MRVTCIHCDGPHPSYECKNKPETATKSTAARKDVPEANMAREAATAVSGLDGIKAPLKAGTQALPVDTIPKTRGRPRTGFDKAAYNRQYMKDKRAGKPPRRAKLKEGKI